MIKTLLKLSREDLADEAEISATVIVMTITEATSHYEGEVLVSNHCPHGKGKLTQVDGTFHEGKWKNGKRHGEGITTYSNGNKYVGTFENDMRVCGTLTYANGSAYKGQFGAYKDQFGILDPTKQPPNGYGIYTTSQGVVMEGFWKNDLAEGYFIITNPDGTKRSHFFRNNKSIDEGVPLFPRYEEGCAICLDDFNHEMGQVVGTCCNHYFHEKCISPAIQRKSDCPLCRTVVESSKLKSIASCVIY